MVIDLVLKATLLLGLSCLAFGLLRRRSPAVRHRLWTLTFAALLVLPVLELALPRWRWPVLPGGAPEPAMTGSISDASPTPASDLTPRFDALRTPWPIAAEAAQTRSTTELSSASDRSEIPGPAEARIERASFLARWSLQQWVLVLWGSIAAGLLSRLLGATWCSIRLHKSSTPVDDAQWLELVSRVRRHFGVRVPIALRTHRRPLTPLVAGILRPVIILPARVLEWPSAARESILLHEMAHIRRHDVALQLLARFACCLYWFHPLAWYGLRRMRIDRESACDDCVIQAGQPPREYARWLVTVARALQAAPSAAVGMAHPSTLESRIRAILDNARPRGPLSRKVAFGIAIAACGVTTVLAVAHPERMARAADQQSAGDPPGGGAPGAEPELPGLTRTLRGKLTLPDGRPAAGARVVVIESEGMQSDGIVRRLSDRVVSDVPVDGQGNYAIRVSQWQARPQLHMHARYRGSEVYFVREGSPLGLRWSVNGDGVIADGQFDDAGQPIEGRLVNLEGEPVVGASVRVLQISAASSSVAEWLEAARHNPDPALQMNMLSVVAVGKSEPEGRRPVPFPAFQSMDAAAMELLGYRCETTTDRNGQFSFVGLGADRLVELEIRGQKLALTRIDVVTRDMDPVYEPYPKPLSRSGKIHGRKFTLSVEPGVTLSGILRDRDSKMPLAGERLRLRSAPPMSHFDIGEVPAYASVTDASGRYELTGLPSAQAGNGSVPVGLGGYRIRLVATSGDYFTTEIALAAWGTQDKVHDIELRRTKRVHGQLVDAATRRPVAGLVGWLPRRDNPHAARYANFVKGMRTISYDDFRPTDEQGNFDVPVGEGAGVLCVAALEQTRYKIADGIDQIPNFVVNRDQDLGEPDIYHLAFVEMANRFVPLEMGKEQAELKLDIELRPGDTFPAEVVDSQGQPVSNVHVGRYLPDGVGMVSARLAQTPAIPGPSVDIVELKRDEKREVAIRLADLSEGRLFVLDPGQWQGNQPLRLQLQPCSRIRGRVLDALGKPIPGLHVTAEAHLPRKDATQAARLTVEPAPTVRLRSAPYEEHVAFAQTDDAGRFELRGIFVGAGYDIRWATQKYSLETLEPGVLVDLGDLQAGTDAGAPTITSLKKQSE